MARLSYIYPDWPAPDRVKAFTTTRGGGCSQGPYAGLNLALHVGDQPASVLANRSLLQGEAGLPDEPLWLQQVHGTRIIAAERPGTNRRADGSYSQTPGKVCCVMSADCLPVLLCDRAGQRVAALHAGWRGLAAGILEQTVATLACPPRDLLAWLGPAIGPAVYEVDVTVLEAFVTVEPTAVEAFTPVRPGHWRADLYALARQRLLHAGLLAIHGGQYCTYSDPERFYSYRRTQPCGRMASLIWLQ